MSTSKKLHHNKVRSGCNTCKQRKVKCDETKPSCLRCTRTGRQCDYTKIIPSIVELHGDPEERRALHIYRETVGPEMSSYFDGPFWTATVLQISHQLPAAKHLLMATGSAYEHLISTTNHNPMKPNDFAITQTSKSVERLLNGSTTLVSILTCCLLFVSYGILMDDLSHLQVWHQIFQIAQLLSRPLNVC